MNRNIRLIFLLFVFAFFGAATASAQYSLKLVVQDVATKPKDDIYVTGSFNNWDAGNFQYKLKPFGPGRKIIVIKDLPAGKIAFKFTRGNWDKVETDAKGYDVDNRVADVQEDVTVNCAIAGWKDDFPDKPIPNTATANVSVMDTAFFIPQLNRHRRIWIYLPASYQRTQGKRYPVLYMNDGQNLFNLQTAPFGEWGVDEALDSLQRKTGKECIVVGIDHGGSKRLNEYNPYNNDSFGVGEGRAYTAFVAETLKPYIDKHYRTLTDVGNTFIAGSSMGGLISLYAAISYPNVFGSAGIFSPAFWISPQMYTAVADSKWSTKKRMYFYAGGRESKSMVKDMEKMIKLLQTKGNYEIISSVDPQALHNEAAWRKEFPAFYLWLMK